MEKFFDSITKLISNFEEPSLDISSMKN